MSECNHTWECYGGYGGVEGSGKFFRCTKCFLDRKVPEMGPQPHSHNGGAGICVTTVSGPAPPPDLRPTTAEDRTNTARKYTLADLEEMREIIFRQTFTSGFGGGYAQSLETGMQLTIISAERTKIVEEKLRTYMLAGLGPDDLRNATESPTP